MEKKRTLNIYKATYREATGCSDVTPTDRRGFRPQPGRVAPRSRPAAPQGPLPGKTPQRKVSRQSGHVDLLLEVNHLYWKKKVLNVKTLFKADILHTHLK